MPQTHESGDTVKPWRIVRHIENRIGPHGGRYWLLTLECGHLKCARKPCLRPYQIFRRIRFAPKKVACLVCP